MAERLEAVFLDQVEDGDSAFMLDIGRRTADRIVKDDVAKPEFALRHALTFRG
jgi:hypothetical protein